MTDTDSFTSRFRQETLLVDRDGGLVTVTFNRPERKNAINASMWQELEVAITEFSIDPTIRAVLLTGAEGNFSAGADLSGEGTGGGMLGRGPQPIVVEMRTVGRIVSRLRNLPVPTVAAIDGVAVGVSLGLALACDLVIATDRARLIEIFVKRGLALDGGTSWLTTQLIGARRAKQMAYFGDALDAATAQSWGLVNEVVAPEDLAATAKDWASRLATGPTVALGLIKAQINGAERSSLDEALEGEARAQHIVYTTNDMQEGIKAFIERRPPDFTGR